MNAEIGQPKGHVVSQMFEKVYVCRPPFTQWWAEENK